MKSLWLIISLAALWAVTGVIVGWGLSSLYHTEWIMPCGLSNLIIGLVLLQVVTRKATARKIFYEGPDREGEHSFGVAILWALPFAVALAGLVWWLMSKLMAL